MMNTTEQFGSKPTAHEIAALQDNDRLRAVNAELVAALECVLTRWGHMQQSNGWNAQWGESGSGGLWAGQMLDKSMRVAAAALAKVQS